MLLRDSEKQQDDGVLEKEPSLYQMNCSACHGKEGEGNRELMAPPLVNSSSWYLREQLKKFQNDWRGAQAGDVHGQQMKAVVSELSEEKIEMIIAEVEAFPFVMPERTMEGDSELGAELYRELCAECHRYNGHGEITFKSAPLIGLPDWYIAAQIEKFLKGDRGYHPDDLYSQKMAKMARRPKGEEELMHIIAYIQKLHEQYPVEKGVRERE